MLCPRSCTLSYSLTQWMYTVGASLPLAGCSNHHSPPFCDIFKTSVCMGNNNNHLQCSNGGTSAASGSQCTESDVYRFSFFSFLCIWKYILYKPFCGFRVSYIASDKCTEVVVWAGDQKFGNEKE